MSTTPKPIDSLLLSDAGKPETKPTTPATAATTPSTQHKTDPTKPTKSKEPLATKAHPVNPAWADEVVSSFGLNGQIAKQAATELTAAITKGITAKFTRPKLAKLVRSAVARSIQ